MADYKQLEKEALKKFMVEKVFIRKERLTVMAHSQQEAGELVTSGHGRHAGQDPEYLMGMAVQEIGIDKDAGDSPWAEEEESLVVVPKILRPKGI